MEEWFEAHLGLSADEVGIILAFALPALALLFRQVRTGLANLLGWLTRAWGRPQRRYRTWFLAEYGTLRNIYLNREETLGLADSYISLSVQAEGEGSGTQVAASTLLSESGPHRIVILGDPGTGKSTLLKAYGAGLLRRAAGDSDLNQIGRTGEIPILLTLRQIADFLARGGKLEDHILDVLAKRTGHGNPRALFRRLLRRGRIVVLLDGLDEVAQPTYDAVRVAVHRFVTADEDADLPTGLARVVITCRRQNYRQIEDDWSGWFSALSYVIAPLRDAEITRFVDRRASQFTAHRSREAFLADVRASGTWDMHRVPLVLTISLGLYTQLVGYEIPNSVDDFYDEMVRELLRRHDFKAEGQLRQNKYRADDKHRYLRELALHLAETRASPFADFTYAELIDFFAVCGRTMPRVQDGKAFINEIIDRSGLLAQTSEDGHYAFAHRALHEHLAAAQLVRDPQNGYRFLLDRAGDPQWWQVAVLFCGAGHRYLEPFLTRLAGEHLELACHCLAMAEVSADIAKDLIDRARARVMIGQDTHLLLPAIVEAVKSPVAATRDLAFDALVQGLLWTAHHTDREYQRRIVTALFGGQSPVAGKVLLAMSQHATAEMAEAISLLTSTMPDDEPSLVAPLWHCLSIPGIDRNRRVVRDIVGRLLVLAMNADCAAELDRLPPATANWSTLEDRTTAYPLKKGLPPDANLVTLLGLANSLRILERFPRKNLYLKALTAPGRPLALIETAPLWSRISPYRWASMLAWGGIIGALVGTTAVGILVLTDVLEVPNPNAYVGAGIGIIAFTAVVRWIIRRAAGQYLNHLYGHRPSWWRYLVPAPVPAGPTLIGPFWSAMASGIFWRYEGSASATLWYLWTTAVYGVPAAVLLRPWPWLIPIVLVPVLLIFVWLPSTELCGAFTTRLLLSSRSYMTIYDDPESRHWVLPRHHAARL
ncbi:hypothetical protein ACTI_68040 [Actinoplanes sp. OR16]|uniref:NACHT domain-containing protein n=1 Tax=Actinoplanes sp. OR16 TaxID=946334 RepID=UPI000F6FBD2B|nr:NACHT domain-containing protein [Actinoplanes sp. OR16]BBH70119.1 hypothetical protein ACTI_68040 [Actinoplanes sp. OR16]